MFHAIQSALAQGALDRTTLLINHVLSSEPAAQQRLRAHVGRTVRVQVDGWPGWLPALPVLTFRITPAALLEWTGDRAESSAAEPGSSAPDLHITVQASNPASLLMQALAGQRPRVDVAGDSAFAADVNWLFDNLRWDIEDDLAGVVGPAVAREMARLGRAVAGGLQDAVNTLGGLASRARRGGPPA